MTEVAAIGMSVQCTLNTKRQVVFQTHVAGDAPLSVINGMLTKLHDAADVQEARYMISDLELHLEVTRKQITRIQEDTAHFLATQEAEHQKSGRRGEFKLNGQAAQHVNALEKSLKATVDDEKKIVKNLEEYRKKVAA